MSFNLTFLHIAKVTAVFISISMAKELREKAFYQSSGERERERERDREIPLPYGSRCLTICSVGISALDNDSIFFCCHWLPMHGVSRQFRLKLSFCMEMRH
jgi:hypothetical protein